MESTNNNNQIYRIGLFLSLLLLLAVLFFFYKDNQKYTELQDAFKDEKVAFQSDLDEIIEDYNDAIADKTTLSSRLEMELNKVVQLRDSVKNLKASNYRSIRKYKRRIARLVKENRFLFLKVDSLSSLNYALQKENVSVRNAMMAKDSLNASLTKTNTELASVKENLEGKVLKAGALKTSPITAIAMKERSNGKLVSTSRSSRTDAFRINFNLLENQLATEGEKQVYIQILDSKNNVVASKGTTTLKNATEIAFSDATKVDYHNEDIGVVSLIEVDRDRIHKGKYTINSYVDGLLTSSKIINLR